MGGLIKKTMWIFFVVQHESGSHQRTSQQIIGII